MKAVHLPRGRKSKALVFLVILAIGLTAVFIYVQWDKSKSTAETPNSLDNALYVEEKNAEIEGTKNAIENTKSPDEIVAYSRSLVAEYNNLKQYDKSIEVLKKAILLAPEDYTLHASLAGVYGKNNDKNNAIAEYDQALELAKKNGGESIKIDQYTEYINREKAAL